MKVLLVDDNTDYLRLLKDALSSAGYDILTARDGMEGCETLSSDEVDLIISDICMPVLDGIMLHTFARELPAYKDTKFIFLSGFKEVYKDLAGMQQGKDYFLDKTASLNDIVSLVNELLFGNFSKSWV